MCCEWFPQRSPCLSSYTVLPPQVKVARVGAGSREQGISSRGSGGDSDGSYRTIYSILCCKGLLSRSDDSCSEVNSLTDGFGVSGKIVRVVCGQSLLVARVATIILPAFFVTFHPPTPCLHRRFFDPGAIVSEVSTFGCQELYLLLRDILT